MNALRLRKFSLFIVAGTQARTYLVRLPEDRADRPRVEHRCGRRLVVLSIASRRWENPGALEHRLGIAPVDLVDHLTRQVHSHEGRGEVRRVLHAGGGEESPV